MPLQTSSENTTFDLKQRAGLPPDLAALVKKYPRSVWPSHANLGEMSQFWLQRHEMFRELGAALITQARGLKEQKTQPAEFREWFIPRFWFMLQQLNTHHQIEDGYYFPKFMQADTTLKRGFEMLESDHNVIHHGMVKLQDTGLAFDQALNHDPARILFAADDVAGALDGFIKLLLRHLEDEEDLVIPLVLDRGETTLGFV